MAESRGPRLITHAADEETPTLDPRLQLTAGALSDLRARKAQLEAMRDGLHRGDITPEEVHKAVADGFAFQAR